VTLLLVTVRDAAGKVTHSVRIAPSTLIAFARTGINSLLVPGGSVTIEWADE